jgi:hypothetical protein
MVKGLHRSGTPRHRFVDPLRHERLSEVAERNVAPVPKGGALVLSSRTPHLTRASTTGAVRTAYVLEHAPSGAALLQGGRAVPPPPLPAGVG